MPSKALRQWTIPRRDLAAGGSALVRLAHPLLPVFVSARPGARGLVLGVEGPRPAPLARLDAPARRAYLVRLGSLAGFLSFHGLGLAPEDISLLGRARRATRSGRPSAPLPSRRGARCRPLSRSRPPPSGSAGGQAGGKDAESLRRAVESALDGVLPRDVAEDVVTALRAADARGRSEGLVAELARRGGVGRAVSRDLLGLALPAASRRGRGRAGPRDGRRKRRSLARAGRRAAGGAAGVRGVRGGLRPGPGRRASGASRALLEDDPRAAVLRDLADGSRPTTLGRGPSPRPRRRLARTLGRAIAPRFRKGSLRASASGLFATRAARLEPWEDAPLLSFSLGPGDAASLLWLPFASVHDAVAAWREAEEAARGAAGTTDPGRVLDVARDLAARFDPAEGRVSVRAPAARGIGEARSCSRGRRASRRRVPRRRGRRCRRSRSPGRGGGARERRRERSAGHRGRRNVRVSGRRRAPPDRRAGAGFGATRGGRATRGVRPRGRAIRDRGARPRQTPRTSRRRARRSTWRRRTGTSTWPPRFSPALRGRIPISAGRSSPCGSFTPREGPRPRGKRRAGSRPELRAALHSKSGSRRPAFSSPCARSNRAAALCPGGAPDEDVARARVLVGSCRDGAARRVLARAVRKLGEAPVSLRLQERLLAAELHERAHDYRRRGRGARRSRSPAPRRRRPPPRARARVHGRIPRERPRPNG